MKSCGLLTLLIIGLSTTTLDANIVEWSDKIFGDLFPTCSSLPFFGACCDKPGKTETGCTCCCDGDCKTGLCVGRTCVCKQFGERAQHDWNCCQISATSTFKVNKDGKCDFPDSSNSPACGINANGDNNGGCAPGRYCLNNNCCVLPGNPTTTKDQCCYYDPTITPDNVVVCANAQGQDVCCFSKGIICTENIDCCSGVCALIKDQDPDYKTCSEPLTKCSPNTKCSSKKF